MNRSLICIFIIALLLCGCNNNVEQTKNVENKGQSESNRNYRVAGQDKHKKSEYTSDNETAIDGYGTYIGNDNLENEYSMIIEPEPVAYDTDAMYGGEYVDEYYSTIFEYTDYEEESTDNTVDEHTEDDEEDIDKLVDIDEYVDNSYYSDDTEYSIEDEGVVDSVENTDYTVNNDMSSDGVIDSINRIIADGVYYNGWAIVSNIASVEEYNLEHKVSVDSIIFNLKNSLGKIEYCDNLITGNIKDVEFNRSWDTLKEKLKKLRIGLSSVNSGDAWIKNNISKTYNINTEMLEFLQQLNRLSDYDGGGNT